MNLTIVVGNPKPASRTLGAAQVLAQALSGRDDAVVVDLALLGPDLLTGAGGAASSALAAVARSDLVVVSSPTYKATYTGLLKIFLDRLPTGGLEGVVAVPLMLGAQPRHALAADLLLKPVLVELGATTPAPGLYVDQSAETPETAVPAYVERWGAAITAAVGPTGRR